MNTMNTRVALGALDPLDPSWQWYCRPFAALTPAQLYALLALRAEVFVREQACVYVDPDGLDPQALHLWAQDGAGAVRACARLLPPGLKQALPMVGRVVVASAARGQGAGRRLMQQALQVAAAQWPTLGVALQAQAHLQDFYASLGFVATGPVYDDDGIPHLDMERAPQ